MRCFVTPFTLNAVSYFNFVLDTAESVNKVLLMCDLEFTLDINYSSKQRNCGH